MIRYLAIEGLDGAGKDTQLALLSQALDQAGTTPIVLHEPSHGKHGRALRARLASFPEDMAEQRALFTLDRRDHVARKILPALAFVRSSEGFMLLQNRSILSAAAYQPLGAAERDLRRTVEEQLAFAPMPDRIVVLDVAVEVALRRLRSRVEAHSMERVEVLKGVRERYLSLAAMYPQCVLVDASRDHADVARAVLNAALAWDV